MAEIEMDQLEPSHQNIILSPLKASLRHAALCKSPHVLGWSMNGVAREQNAAFLRRLVWCQHNQRVTGKKNKNKKKLLLKRKRADR